MRLTLLGLLLALAVAPTARAAIVFERGVAHRSVWIAADDGSGAHRLALGDTPRLSPDGTTVVFERVQHDRPDLMAMPADGSAAPRLLAKAWRDPFTFAWSPDGRTIATVVGSELHAKRLALIDVATGTQRTVATGYFAGVSFSPSGDRIVYGRTAHDDYPGRPDVYEAAVGGGVPQALTHDHASEYPLWGPHGQIVYVRLIDAARRKYGPKNELYLMGEDGSGSRRLTHTKVDQLLFGLIPTAWSADGTRLLTQFGGQDTTYAVAVDVATGKQRPLLRAEESGLIATRLSPDGSTVLGSTGGFDPSTRHDVVTVPFSGGAATVLVRGGFNPDWTR
jgi:Tol biopolymer transport system component